MALSVQKERWKILFHTNTSASISGASSIRHLRRVRVWLRRISGVTYLRSSPFTRVRRSAEPTAKSEPVRRSDFTMELQASRGRMSSGSTKVSRSPVVASIPAWRATETPELGWVISVTRGSLAAISLTISADPSVEPSSTTTTSRAQTSRSG